MNTSLISIDKLKEIKLSKFILKRYIINNTIELVLEKDCIIIRMKDNPRKGWDKAFKEMHERGDDKLLMSEVFKDENLDEWI